MHGFLLVFTLGSGPQRAGGDPWFGVDKVQHFFTSAFVQSMTYGSLRATGLPHGVALAGATATTAAVGIGKEIHDLHGGGTASARDLAWDAAGAAAATVLLARTAR
jgi:uncharacterized protein YfiM (DUF2279 family)